MLEGRDPMIDDNDTLQLRNKRLSMLDESDYWIRSETASEETQREPEFWEALWFLGESSNSGGYENEELRNDPGVEKPLD